MRLGAKHLYCCLGAHKPWSSSRNYEKLSSGVPWRVESLVILEQQNTICLAFCSIVLRRNFPFFKYEPVKYGLLLLICGCKGFIFRHGDVLNRPCRSGLINFWSLELYIDLFM